MGDGNLATKLKQSMTGTPYTSPGAWKQDAGNGNFDTVGDINSAAGAINTPTYTALFFAALTAAVERDIPNAAAAWERVYGTNGRDGGVSNLLAWRASMGHLPHWNRWPRNK
jgi:hypothetical protein